MSCSCNNSCDPEHEPLPSTVDNFVKEFFGQVTKTCVNGEIVWTLPCDLDEGIPGYPRLPDEGLACYFTRVLEAIIAGGGGGGGGTLPDGNYGDVSVSNNGTTILLNGSVVETANFASTIQPIALKNGVPSVKDTDVIFNTVDNKLYRWNGTAYIAYIPSTDITGQITSTQITDGAISTPKLAAGAVDANKIAAGSITSGKLAADSVIAGKIAAGAVNASALAAGSVTADKMFVDNLAAITANLGTATGGVFKSGSATTFSSGVGFFLGKDVDDIYKFRVGNPATGYISWDGSTWSVVNLPTGDGFIVKDPVRVATVGSNVTLSGGAPSTLDDITLVASDRILVKDQTDPIQNGIYVVSTVGTGSNGTWARSADADATGELDENTYTFVTEGTLNASTSWVVTSPNPVNVGTDPVIWTKFFAVSSISFSSITGTIDPSQIADGSIAGTKFASGLKGIEVVASLPSTNNVIGRVVFLTTTDGANQPLKLYRWTSSIVTTGKDYWTAVVPAVDITGQITAGQIADGSVSGTKFASDIKPVEVVASLPAAGTAGRVAFLTSDNKLYRDTGSAWTAAVPTGDLTGQISAAQIQAGSITSDKIAANSITTGMIQAGAIQTSQLAAGSVTATTIASNSITAIKLAAGSVEADKIATNAITSDKIQANAITTGMIQAGAVKTDQLDSNAVTAAKIAALTITADKIASNAITTGKLAVGAIGGWELTSTAIKSFAGVNRIELNSSTGIISVGSGSSPTQIGEDIFTGTSFIRSLGSSGRTLYQLTGGAVPVGVLTVGNNSDLNQIVLRGSDGGSGLPSLNSPMFSFGVSTAVDVKDCNLRVTTGGSPVIVLNRAVPYGMTTEPEIWINGQKVVKQRYTGSVTNTAEIIACLQYHGLCN
jgi:hypothetical protein